MIGTLFFLHCVIGSLGQASGSLLGDATTMIQFMWQDDVRAAVSFIKESLEVFMTLSL